MTALLFTVAILSLALAAFCAGSETAFMSVGRGRVTHLAREGSAAANAVMAALRDMNKTLTSLLIGNNLAHVVFSSSAAALGARLMRGSVSHAIWTLGSAFLVLYLSEFLPKLFCSTRPLRRSLALAPAFSAFARAFYPLTAVAMAITNMFIPKAEPKDKVTANELMRILKDRKDGVKLTDFESALIARILLLRRQGAFITPDSLLVALDEAE